MKRIFLTISCLIFVCFLFTGCGYTDKIAEINEKNKQKYTEQATKNVETYLERKYPDLEYEITNVFCKQKSHMVIVNDFVPITYLPDVTVYIETPHNEHYSIITDASKNGQDGVSSCKDNVQYDIVLYELEMLARTMCPEVYSSVISVKVECNQEYFKKKFDGDMETFLYIESTINKSLKFYLQYFYANANIDYNEIELKERSFLRYFEQAVFVDFIDETNAPLNTMLINSTDGVSLNRLYPYSLRVESVHIYQDGGFLVYKNQLSEVDGITYLIPFSFYDKSTFNSDKLIEISHWKMAIRDNMGYEGVQIEDIVPITNLYRSKMNYIYFLSKEKFNFNRMDGKYFLLTHTDGKFEAEIIDTKEDIDAMMFDDSVFVGPMKSDTYWQIVFVPNSAKMT